MSAPLRDDDHQARADLEADCVRAEREYAIERHERLERHNDFVSAGRAPRALLGEADGPGLDIPSSGSPARWGGNRARATSLLYRIFTPAMFGATGERRRVRLPEVRVPAATFFALGPSRSTYPLGANGGAGGRSSWANAGPATTSKPLTAER